MWESPSDPPRCPLEPAIRSIYAGNVIPYGFKVDPWTITNPVVAIDGAIAAPFAARALVAWIYTYVTREAPVSGDPYAAVTQASSLIATGQPASLSLTFQGAFGEWCRRCPWWSPIPDERRCDSHSG
jgi:hypothetical protein